MNVGYKNLILIDNSRSMGEVNFRLTKETAKYICQNMDSEDSCRIATFGEDVEYIDDYTDDADALSLAIDELEMYDRDTYITDNLVNILNEWKEQDVACRNIILFTDGRENESPLHANEELYYMLSDMSYPVYIVQCVETINDPASKNLSAIATLSRGRLLLSEFEGSDGGSETIMGDTILGDINEARKSAEEEENETVKALEETEDADESLENTEEADKSGEALYIDSDKQEDIPDDRVVTHLEKDAYSAVDTSPVIVRKKDTGREVGFSVVFPVLGVLFAVVFALVIYLITHRNSRIKKRDRRAIGRMGYYSSPSRKMEARIAEDAEDVDCSTMKLSDDEGATRLLGNEEGGYNIVLEDCRDPTRIYRAGCTESLIVGRSVKLCDIVIDHDDSISGRHCELSVIDGNWYVRDLKSSNGTRVNSQKIFQELLLKNGDILMVGQTALQVGI